MKTDGKMRHGGKLRKECSATWAKFFVRFAEEFAARGIKLWGCTVQNEVLATTPWENCIYNAHEERDFVRDHLGPALEAAQLDLKLMVWDHNRDEIAGRVLDICSDPEADKYIWGVAYHWYGDPRYELWPPKAGMVKHSNLSAVHDRFPNKHLVMTEGCQEGCKIGDWKLAERYAENIINDLNNWVEGWVDWNLVLDVTGGPNHCGNYCSAPIHVSGVPALAAFPQSQCEHLIFNPNYYALGHFSRYIRPGAERIWCVTSRDALEATAFINTDDTIALVILNRMDEEIKFWIEIQGHAAEVVAPEHSITTFLLQPPSSWATTAHASKSSQIGDS